MPLRSINSVTANLPRSRAERRAKEVPDFAKGVRRPRTMATREDMPARIPINSKFQISNEKWQMTCRRSFLIFHLKFEFFNSHTIAHACRSLPPPRLPPQIRHAWAI